MRGLFLFGLGLGFGRLGGWRMVSFRVDEAGCYLLSCSYPHSSLLPHIFYIGTHCNRMRRIFQRKEQQDVNGYDVKTGCLEGLTIPIKPTPKTASTKKPKKKKGHKRNLILFSIHTQSLVRFPILDLVQYHT